MDVTLRRVPREEKPDFEAHFQDYLAELARLSGAHADRKGVYRYDILDSYWLGEDRMPFYVECDGRPAGVLLLRVLPAKESAVGRESLQVAEISVFPAFRRRSVGRRAMELVAEMAAERQLPLTWSAYMNNQPANALYRSVLAVFRDRDESWEVERSRGIDRTGLARYYYRMTPPTVSV